MRFLKKLLDFKKKEYDNLSDEEIQDIKDIFRDYADGYDLEELNTVFGEKKNTYLFVKLYDEDQFSDNQAPMKLDTTYLLISVYLVDKKQTIIFNNHINSDFKKRLESMGYDINISLYESSYSGVQIIPVVYHTKMIIRKIKLAI